MSASALRWWPCGKIAKFAALFGEISVSQSPRYLANYPSCTVATIVDQVSFVACL